MKFFLNLKLIIWKVFKIYFDLKTLYYGKFIYYLTSGWQLLGHHNWAKLIISKAVEIYFDLKILYYDTSEHTKIDKYHLKLSRIGCKHINCLFSSSFRFSLTSLVHSIRSFLVAFLDLKRYIFYLQKYLLALFKNVFCFNHPFLMICTKILLTREKFYNTIIGSYRATTWGVRTCTNYSTKINETKISTRFTISLANLCVHPRRYKFVKCQRRLVWCALWIVGFKYQLQ